MEKKYLKFGLAALILALIILIILVWSGVLKLAPERKVSTDKETAPAEAEIKMAGSREAYELALARARLWQSDAALTSLNSSVEEARRSVWHFLFVSKTRNTGFAVEAADGQIISAAETPFSGSGAELPPDIISPEEAIKRARQVGGYEREPVLGVEAVFGPTKNIWYWGVRTPRGTVTIEAKQK